jgi:hypothetical protein
MLHEGRIAQKANAYGKAKGSADVSTLVWMVKAQVGVEKL